MTPLEDRVRDAIQAKAAEVPPDAVPPLRLPARHRSSFSLAHGGRERAGGLAGRAWAAPLAAAAGVAAALAVVFALTGVIHPGRSAPGQPAGLAALPRFYVALAFTGSAAVLPRRAGQPADQGRRPRHHHGAGPGHRAAAPALPHVRRGQRGG